MKRKDIKVGQSVVLVRRSYSTSNEVVEIADARQWAKSKARFGGYYGDEVLENGDTWRTDARPGSGQGVVVKKMVVAHYGANKGKPVAEYEVVSISRIEGLAADVLPARDAADALALENRRQREEMASNRIANEEALVARTKEAVSKLREGKDLTLGYGEITRGYAKYGKGAVTISVEALQDLLDAAGA